MTFVLLLPTILSFLTLAAHFMRGGSVPLVVASVGMCALLAVRRWWSVKVIQVALILAGVEWAFTAQALIEQRTQEYTEWHRAAAILLGVAAFNVLAAALFKTQRLRTRYNMK